MLKTILNKPLEMFNTVARWCDHLPGSRTFPSPQGESLHPLNSGPAPLAGGQPLPMRFLPVELLILDPEESESRAVGPWVWLQLLAQCFRGGPQGAVPGSPLSTAGDCSPARVYSAVAAHTPAHGRPSGPTRWPR